MNFTFLDNVKLGRTKWWTFIPVIFFITLLFWITVLIPDQVNLILKNIFSYLPLSQPLRYLLVQVIYYGFILFLWLVMCFVHKRRFITLLTVYKRIRWRNVLKGMFLWFIFLGLVELVCFYLMPGNYTYTFKPENFIYSIIISLTLCILTGVTEETFFRGYLMQVCGLISKKPIILLLITSILFGLLHWYTDSTLIGNIIHVFGLLLGVIVLGEGRLEIAIGMYTIHNLYLEIICGSPTIIVDPTPIITYQGACGYIGYFCVINSFGDGVVG